MVSGESPDPWLVAQKTGEVGAAEWAEPDPARTRNAGRHRGTRGRLAETPSSATRSGQDRDAPASFPAREVEMRPDKPRLPRHDLIEGFLQALGFHLHQKPRLEVAGQELVRSPSIELERAVIVVGTKRLNSSCLSMCGQWLVSVTGMCAKRVRARGERSGFSDAGRPPSRRDRVRCGRLDRQDSRTGTDPATSTRSRYNL